MSMYDDGPTFDVEVGLWNGSERYPLAQFTDHAHADHFAQHLPAGEGVTYVVDAWGEHFWRGTVRVERDGTPCPADEPMTGARA